MSNAATPRWVVAECGGLQIGLSAQQAREILDAPAWTRLPGGQSAVGVISVRGRILPVFALDQLLGVGRATGTDRPVVLVEVEGRGAGLAVDRVVTVVAASLNAASRESALFTGARGTGAYAGGTFIGLDAAALLQDAFRARQAEMEDEGEWHARS